MFQMPSEVSPGDLGIGRVTPLDLSEPGQRVAQVRDIQVPACIMMGEVPQLPPFSCGLDRSKGGIRKLPDVLPAPLRAFGGRSGQQEQTKQDPEETSHPHLASIRLPAAPISSAAGLDGAARAFDASPFLW
jgi:hypothetical protein